MMDLLLTNQHISVIIPTLNEVETLPLTLKTLKRIQTATNVEVIVVDGGSLDATVQIAKSLGQIAIAPAAVVTSGRRWRKLNVCRTTLINQLMILGYLLKVLPARLAHWYRSWGK